MPKTILAPVAGYETDNVILEAAHLAARIFGSHIEGLFIRTDIGELLARTVALNMGMPVVTPELWSSLESEDKARSARSRATFDSFCRRTKVTMSDIPLAAGNISASWHEVIGDPTRQIIRHSRINELTVLGMASDIAPGQIGDVLMECGRPLLLVPKAVPGSLATRVVIAWKETAEAARALTAAMPFLVNAQKVFILSADERGSHATTIESAERLKRALRWDGIDAELRRLPESPDISTQILDAASGEGADFMVMGGYTHSRARELIFGGLTRQVLHNADLPMLMCH